MPVIIYKWMTLANIPPLSKESPEITDVYAHIKEGLKKDPKFTVWEIPRYTSFGGRVSWTASNLRVSIKGMIAYQVGKSLRMSTGIFKNGVPSVHIPTLTYSEYFPLDRIIACTFLPIPEELVEYPESELKVGRINGQKHQVHLANLKWMKP